VLPHQIWHRKHALLLRQPMSRYLPHRRQEASFDSYRKP